MKRVPVYILAGGKSSRFGKDKALASISGQPMLCHISQSIEPIARSITVVADKPGKYDHLNMRTIGDRNTDLGPIGGLQAALADRSSDGWLFLMSCDLLGVRSHWINLLLEAPREKAQVVAFREANRWEPLFTLYHTSICPNVDGLIAGESYPLWRVLTEVNAVALPYPADWNNARNINTPSDLDFFAQV